MFCPRCFHANPVDAVQCPECHLELAYLPERIFLGMQFVFVKADAEHPVALKVDGERRDIREDALISRLHDVSLGNVLGKPAPTPNGPLTVIAPDSPRISHEPLKLRAVITDRLIYKPGTEAAIFVAASDAPGAEAALEIYLAKQKVYETKVLLDPRGLTLHRYADFKEGEYSVTVRFPDGCEATTEFSAAEFTLSPLIAILDNHEYAAQRLKFHLRILLLSRPYSGPLELGLQCKVCAGQVVATQKVEAREGAASGEFDISSHGGPFHVQLTTPDGHTALIAFPGTGAQEREHIRINPLGQTVDAGLLPWGGARPVRGLYHAPGEVAVTPLMLESAHAERGVLKAASELSTLQVVAIDPCSGKSEVVERARLARGETLEFPVSAPYVLFHAGAFTKDRPFEGWGMVFKPETLEAKMEVPSTARPGDPVDVKIRIAPRASSGGGGSKDDRKASCLLLVYDVRLEHESPVPKLAKRMYESLRAAAGQMGLGAPESVRDVHERARAEVPAQPQGSGGILASLMGRLRRVRSPRVGISYEMSDRQEYRPMLMMESIAETALAAAPGQVGDTFAGMTLSTASRVESPAVPLARSEFPELAFLKFFEIEGEATSTARLGDQIGTWRARAYVFAGVDCVELTADIPADKSPYAELDVPAIASEGDDIAASVNYVTREPAELVIATPFGEVRERVRGAGAMSFPIRGPGRVEVRIEGPSGADRSLREVARPGVQRVTASRIAILDRGETARGEKVAVFPSVGQVLAETVTALIHYPFG